MLCSSIKLLLIIKRMTYLLRPRLFELLTRHVFKTNAAYANLKRF